MYSEIRTYCETHGVTLVVVSKKREKEEVLKIYQQGQRIFAENRVQDLLDKKEILPADIDWHLIGTLQSNKVKYIAPFIKLIHSLDDYHLWGEINRQAIKNNRIIPCLLQIKIAKEDTKSGFDWNELIDYLDKNSWSQYASVQITGVMGMATFTEELSIVQQEFRQLKEYFSILKARYFTKEGFDIISMGMSGDYTLAIAEGSTMVRIGSLIFEH